MFIAQVFFGIILFSLRGFTLENDFKNIDYEDLFCSFRGYMGYVL
jgi:hypothetical protein